MFRIRRIGTIITAALLVCVMALGGCTDGGSGTQAQQTAMQAKELSAITTEIGQTDVLDAITGEYDDTDLDDSWDSGEATRITLSGSEISVQGEGAAAQMGIVTITDAGTYVVCGTADDAQIVVNAGDDDVVRLVLNGASITCADSAPVYVFNADKTIIILANGTRNSVSSGADIAQIEATGLSAAIFSKDDLCINGSGELSVNAVAGNGIQSKDDLKITGGTITVTAGGDGLKGKDSIVIKAGDITIDAQTDGLEATNDTDADKGYIVIDGGTLRIAAGLDGIQAQTRVCINGGDITVTSGGGSVNSSNGDNWGQWGGNMNMETTETEETSAKGIKAVGDITVAGGAVSIDSSDDAIHSNGTAAVTGGDIAISSGDDGIHSDCSLVISGGSVTISQSYEGIESATMTISGGEVSVTADDDGMNTAGGSDGSSLSDRPGMNGFDETDGSSLAISGGYIIISASGDGIDVNGDLLMTDGTVIINGPTNDGNGALDYAGTFQIDGGLLVAAGSAGMAMSPSATSTQNSVMIGLTDSQSEGTLVHIESTTGENVLTFTPSKQYQSVVVCSPDLTQGETYTVYLGGSDSGTNTAGLYEGGVYTAGTKLDSFTVSGTVTTVGSATGNMNGGMGGNRGMQEDKSR